MPVQFVIDKERRIVLSTVLSTSLGLAAKQPIAWGGR